jgi:hypothetical protein
MENNFTMQQEAKERRIKNMIEARNTKVLYPRRTPESGS